MTEKINPVGEFDAMIWANAFGQTLQENPNIVSKDTMLGWFANAIMAGYDRAKRESSAELAKLQTERGELIEDICNYQADLARRDEIIKRLKEDGESLSSVVIGGVTRDAEDYWECPYCMAMAYNAGDIHHAPDCPITLHRALMQELEDK